MPVSYVEDATCDACGEPATHVDTGFIGQMSSAEQGWACDDPYHHMSIDFEPISDVFPEQIDE